MAINENKKYSQSNEVPNVLWGNSIIKRLMMLKPCAKEIKYQGHGSTDLRNTCTLPNIASNTSKTGSHHF